MTKRKGLDFMASKYFKIYAPGLAIDMGTANIRVASEKDGKVKISPGIVALDILDKKVLAIGKSAKDLIGKSPENLLAVKPFEEGSISDFELSQALIEHYINEAGPGFSLFGPSVAMSASSYGGEVEARALQDACYQAGAKEVTLIDQALAAAYGSGFIDIKTGTNGTLVVDIGAGLSTVSIVSAFGLITSECLYKAGDYIDRKIAMLLRKNFDLIVGFNTAELLKMQIGSFFPDKQKNAMQVGGRDVLTGMPKSVDVYSSDIFPVIEEYGQELIETIKKTLEKTPPELAGDVVGKGICLTGGLALLDGLAEYIKNRLNVNVITSDSPIEDVVKGALILLKSKDKPAKRRKG